MAQLSQAVTAREDMQQVVGRRRSPRRRAAGRCAHCILSVLIVLLSKPAAATEDADDAAVRDAPPVGRWSQAASMRERREYAGGVVLPDGRILAVSGHPLGGQSLSSAEVYDPATDRWTTIGSLAEARNSGNQATLLADGRVLVAGGHSQQEVISGTELLDVESGTWAPAGQLHTPRDAAMVRLGDDRILCAGGINWFAEDGRVTAVCELFDPITEQWTETGSMNAPRSHQRMVLLKDGRVLSVGGYDSDQQPVAGTEIYDPEQKQWMQVADLPEPRAWFSMVRLEDGRAMVAGGFNKAPTERRYLNSVLAFDSAKNRWVPLAPMRRPRAGCSLTVISGRYVLAAGGVTGRMQETAAAEIYDVETDRWFEAAPMHTERRNHRAAMLPDGEVLIIGGSNHAGHQYLNSCEIFRLGASPATAE